MAFLWGEGSILDKIKDRMPWNSRAGFFLSISTISCVTSKVSIGHVVKYLNYIYPITVQACIISRPHQNYDEGLWPANSMTGAEH